MNYPKGAIELILVLYMLSVMFLITGITYKKEILEKFGVGFAALAVFAQWLAMWLRGK